MTFLCPASIDWGHIGFVQSVVNLNLCLTVFANVTCIIEIKHLPINTVYSTLYYILSPKYYPLFNQGTPYENVGSDPVNTLYRISENFRVFKKKIFAVFATSLKSPKIDTVNNKPFYLSPLNTL